MAEQSILLNVYNNGKWDNVYPETKASLVKTSNGGNVESILNNKFDKSGGTLNGITKISKVLAGSPNINNYILQLENNGGFPTLSFKNNGEHAELYLSGSVLESNKPIKSSEFYIGNKTLNELFYTKYNPLTPLEFPASNWWSKYGRIYKPDDWNDGSLAVQLGSNDGVFCVVDAAWKSRILEVGYEYVEITGKRVSISSNQPYNPSVGDIWFQI